MRGLFYCDPDGPSALILCRLLNLSGVYRKGWKIRGVSKGDLENDVEHSLRLHSICFRLLKSSLRKYKRLDRYKLGCMAIIHDFDEAIIGDEVRRPPFEQIFAEDPRLVRILKNIDPSQSRETKSDRAVKMMAFETLIEQSNWPREAKVLASGIYSEFIFGYSDEAKAVHQAHAVANIEQGLDYMVGRTRSGKRYNLDLSGFWEDLHLAAMVPDGPFDLEPEVGRLRNQERLIARML